MPKKPNRAATFETLPAGAKPEECALKIYLAKTFKGGFLLSCKGPENGRGRIFAGQKHFVIRTSRTKKLLHRYCGIQCYDEYIEKYRLKK